MKITSREVPGFKKFKEYPHVCRRSRLMRYQGDESKGNFSEEPTCTRTTFQGAHTQSLGKCIISFHSKGIMSNKYFKSTIYETQNQTVLSRC